MYSHDFTYPGYSCRHNALQLCTVYYLPYYTMMSKSRILSIKMQVRRLHSSYVKSWLYTWKYKRSIPLPEYRRDTTPLLLNALPQRLPQQLSTRTLPFVNRAITILTLECTIPPTEHTFNSYKGSQVYLESPYQLCYPLY